MAKTYEYENLERRFLGLVEKYETLNGSYQVLKKAFDEQYQLSNRFNTASTDYASALNRVLQQLAGDVIARKPELIKDITPDDLAGLIIDIATKRELKLHNRVKTANETFKLQIESLQEQIEELTTQLEQRNQMCQSLENQIITMTQQTIAAARNKKDTRAEMKEPESFVPPAFQKNDNFQRQEVQDVEPHQPPQSNQQPVQQKVNKPPVNAQGPEPELNLAKWLPTIKQWDDTLGEAEIEIIREIGESGEYLAPTIIPKLQDKNGNNPKFERSILFVKFKELVNAGILEIEAEKIGSPGGRGTPASIYKLTDPGKFFYQRRFNKQPVPSLIIELERMHKSPTHGHIIRSIGDELKRRGYEIEYEHVEKIGDGRSSSICDIRASKNARIHRIEYEEGNYSEQDYLDKIRRILAVTTSIYFVVKNIAVKQNLTTLISQYLRVEYGHDAMAKFRAAGGVVSVITLDEFNRSNEWPVNPRPSGPSGR